MKMLGNKNYSITYLPSVIREDIPNLPKTMRNRIRQAIDLRLMTNPSAYGKPLQRELKGLFRLRVGDYRLIYEIDNTQNVIIIHTIKHRSYVYTN